MTKYGCKNAKPTCQVRNKHGHSVLICFYRFDENFNQQNQPNTIATYVASPQATIDPAWYFDSGATNSVTHDADNLAKREAYEGLEKLTIGNGDILNISHTGKAL